MYKEVELNKILTTKTRKILARHVMEDSRNCMENPQKKTAHQRLAWSRLNGPKKMRRITLVHWKRRE